MGRRKIEIKAIKDDRNRSVTFLKRKGGLFKKAHELSVLCSVDVAVIVFGQNKKLYEFCSGDINEVLGRYQYFGGAHERKGPADFMGKGNGDDEDEDEENAGSPPPDAYSPPQPEQHTVAPQLQNPNLQHMRHHTPSASPPISNGAFQPRRPTPQPQNISRPSSRNDLHPGHVRQTSSSSLGHHPQQISVTGPPQPSYHYMPNAQMYQNQPSQGIPLNHPHVQQHPSPQPPQYVFPQPTANLHPHHNQMQQVFLEEQRRQSMPPSFPQQDRAQQAISVSSSPQPQPRRIQTPPVRDPVALHTGPKSHSIFTPIDDSRSLLAQHWGSTNNANASRLEPVVKTENGVRAQSVDVGAISRSKAAGVSPQPPKPSRLSQNMQSTSSASSVPNFGPPPRTNSVQSEAKRPRLKVQIPSEQSDGGSATAESSPKESANTTTDTLAKSASVGSAQGSGVVLPPPSPSASTILSAGAQGPPNPFARPAPPSSNIRSTSQHDSRDIETPISALPSRFVAEGLLPSPSSFYPEWGFGRSGDSNMLPSPLNFHTPIGALGINFKDDDNERKKRPSENEDSGGANKKLKS